MRVSCSEAHAGKFVFVYVSTGFLPICFCVHTRVVVFHLYQEFNGFVKLVCTSVAEQACAVNSG